MPTGIDPWEAEGYMTSIGIPRAYGDRPGVGPQLTGVDQDSPCLRG